LYFGLGYLPKKVDVRAGVLRPERYAALIPAVTAP
jgi:hypothetical protein